MSLISTFIRISWAKAMEYKTDFYFMAVTIFLNLATSILFWLFLSSSQLIVLDWRYPELLIYACVLTLGQTMGEFFFGLGELPYSIMKGQIDVWLTKPINIYGMLIGAHLNLAYILAKLVIASISLGIGLIYFSIPIRISSILLMLVLMIVGTLVNQLFQLSIYALAYWVDKVDFLSQLFYQFQDFLQYPLDCFPSLVRYGLTFLLPYALLSYYPSLVLLGRLEEPCFLILIMYFAILIVFTIISVAVVRLGERHYDSNGG